MSREPTPAGHSRPSSRVLEEGPGAFSYPALIQGTDDRVPVTYTWNRRRTRYAALDPDEP